MSKESVDLARSALLNEGLRKEKFTHGGVVYELTEPSLKQQDYFARMKERKDAPWTDVQVSVHTVIKNLRLESGELVFAAADEEALMSQSGRPDGLWGKCMATIKRWSEESAEAAKNSHGVPSASSSSP